jgi:glycolate dehydrogenase iron-sulfur subunit
MQTNITEHFLNTPQGQEANDILRSCVHCGFCTATCPTYQLLGDELDSPRGRIYLIKQLLEGQQVTRKTQTHLDRCLTCRSCETTCPSGVQYGRLVDIGRELVDEQVTRSPLSRLQRFALRKILPYPQRFSLLLKTGQLFKPFLPAAIKQKIPDSQKQKKVSQPDNKQIRKMLVLQGCAQSVATPNTNHAATSILSKLGIELLYAKEAGCCGAVSHHLSAPQEALDFMRRNIDAWWPYVEQGAEAIITTASGCGVVVKDYRHLLKQDALYADKAIKISQLVVDISEVLTKESLPLDRIKPGIKNISFHSPCTLQHGQKLDGVVESILTKCGFTLNQIEDSHLCCGSAGTYSILQKDLSQQLLNNKLIALQKHKPDLIATANVGCQLHMQTKSKLPVKHWIELLDESFV